MILLAILAGVVIGLALGALGGGGSILTVPVLVYLVGLDAYPATSASLIIVGTTSLFALIPHARRGHVRVTQGVVFGVVGIAGSLLGGRAAARIPEPLLLGGFALLMLMVAVIMLRHDGREDAVTDSEGDDAARVMPASVPMVSVRPLRVRWPRLLKLVAAATAVGFLTGFFGVGGGFALVPALVLVLGFSMPVAVGTSLLVIVLNSATALSTRLTTSLELDWPLIAGFTLVAVLASLVAGQLSARLPQRVLTRTFAIGMIVVGLGMGIHTGVTAL
ncbi:MAG: sulfite exporter TauE/SafE family protein [Actinomycetales bacterium]|nr:sulfite exporter TauE/SafE family protein [Actinomycetales bacterium]